MAVINMASITSKVNAYLKTPAGKQKVNSTTIKAILTAESGAIKCSPEEVAATFVSTMLESARSAAFGATAYEAISGFSAGAPAVSNAGEMVVITIPFSFTGDLHRDSLAPETYGGVDNIVALLNNGYTAGGTVYGQWHGKQIHSLRKRTGTHFIQSAVRQFWDKYAGVYNILNIEVSGEYT